MWFRKHLPDREDAQDYITYNTYECPLIAYFKRETYNTPYWDINEASTSFSIFPPNVVVALPSVRSRFDTQGSATPYMVIETGCTNPVPESAVLGRYDVFKDAEVSRLMSMTAPLLKHMISRKHKDNGQRYSSSGTKDKLAAFIFDCDKNFLTFRYLRNTVHQYIVSLCHTWFYID
jgi:hypothetical protein